MKTGPNVMKLGANFMKRGAHVTFAQPEAASPRSAAAASPRSAAAASPPQDRRDGEDRQEPQRDEQSRLRRPASADRVLPEAMNHLRSHQMEIEPIGWRGRLNGERLRMVGILIRPSALREFRRR